MENMNTSNDPFFLQVPFSKRWDYHKETILRLYVTDDRKVEDVADTMKNEYMFDANVRQYKYHFKNWGVMKSVPSKVKRKAIEAIERRVRDGIHVGGVRHKGVEVDKKRLRRQIQSELKSEQDWQLDSVIFSNWCLPYNALKASVIHNIDISSPLNFDESTPSDLSVFSPRQPSNRPSPASAPSPMNAPTPTTMAIRVRTFDNRAKYLLQGRNHEFLKNMPPSEQRIATTWLYQFWLFAFSTAKYWGKGPVCWSFDLLDFMKFSDKTTLPNTPAATDMNSSQHDEFRLPGSGQLVPPPLCRWGIHCSFPAYVKIPSPSDEPETEFDRSDPDSWSRWSKEEFQDDLAARLQEGLQSNSFSDIDPSSLPLSASQVAKAASRSPNELQVEAVGFAIMAQNEELLWELLENPLDLTKLYPFHLAATYLNGAKTCCLIIHELMSSLVRQNLIKNLYVNESGYTVLDSLMLQIIKAHTYCTPAVCDDQMRKSQRFLGEEVDICGRWDADSPCIRALNAQGAARIPFEWKHMFCHTSAQAICHSIIAIFSHDHSPDIDTPSGLFTKYCQNCRQKLSLLPLHTLVLITFYLAHQGCKGETLFGSLACMVCLLSYGANPLQKADISVQALLGLDDSETCSHTAIDPLELAQQVPVEMQAAWNQETRLGWDVIVEVLVFAQKERSKPASGYGKSGHQAYSTDDDAFETMFDFGLPSDPVHSDDEDEPVYNDESEPCQHENWGPNFYGKSVELGKLWASIQTELVTYRQLGEGDPWLSDNFSMRAVLKALKSGLGMDTLPHIERAMLKAFCKCGRFFEAESAFCTRAEDASAYYFSNLDDWQRSEFLMLPDGEW